MQLHTNLLVTPILLMFFDFSLVRIRVDRRIEVNAVRWHTEAMTCANCQARSPRGGSQRTVRPAVQLDSSSQLDSTALAGNFAVRLPGSRSATACRASPRVVASTACPHRLPAAQ